MRMAECMPTSELTHGPSGTTLGRFMTSQTGNAVPIRPSAPSCPAGALGF